VACTAKRSQVLLCVFTRLEEESDSGPIIEPGVVLSRKRQALLAALAELRIAPVGSCAIDETAKPSRRASAGKVLVWLKQQWDAHKAPIYLGISTMILLLLLWSGWTQPQPKGEPAQSELPAFEELLGFRNLRRAVPTMATRILKSRVDVHTGLYYCPGAQLYGRTQGGELTTRDKRGWST
jgi:hypothetical protein